MMELFNLGLYRKAWCCWVSFLYCSVCWSPTYVTMTSILSVLCFCCCSLSLSNTNLFSSACQSSFSVWWSKALPSPRTQNKPIKIFESVILSFKTEETYWSQTCFVCECRQKLYVAPDIFCPIILQEKWKGTILYFVIKQHFLGPHSLTQNLPRYYHS